MSMDYFWPSGMKPTPSVNDKIKIYDSNGDDYIATIKHIIDRYRYIATVDGQLCVIEYVTFSRQFGPHWRVHSNMTIDYINQYYETNYREN